MVYSDYLKFYSKFKDHPCKSPRNSAMTKPMLQFCFLLCFIFTFSVNSQTLTEPKDSLFSSASAKYQNKDYIGCYTDYTAYLNNKSTSSSAFYNRVYVPITPRIIKMPFLILLKVFPLIKAVVIRMLCVACVILF